MDSPRTRTLPLAVLAVVLLVVGLGAGVWLLANLDDPAPAEVPTEQQVLGTAAPTTTAGSSTTRGSGSASPTTAGAARVTTTRPAKDADGLTVVTAAQLPKEARATLALIAAGGPYPYERDGIVFQNREGVLPKKPSGYYHEYTVITPGESDRGARRIVAGDGGERYYTADHYESFVRVAS